MGDDERLAISSRPATGAHSETWTRRLNEIRELGRLDSTKRTPEQTTIGRFWFVTGPRSYNPIVRQVAIAKDMDIVDCARLFALSPWQATTPSSRCSMRNIPITSGDQSRRSATPTRPATRPRRATHHGCRSATRRCIRNIRARTASPRPRFPRSSRRGRRRGRGDLNDQPNRTGRYPQMDAPTGL